MSFATQDGDRYYPDREPYAWDWPEWEGDDWTREPENDLTPHPFEEQWWEVERIESGKRGAIIGDIDLLVDEHWSIA